MDNKKEMERAELHRAIWQIANDLRGSVDGWDFKQYVLGTLFYRYISEKLTNYLNREAQEAGEADFDYAALPDEEAETERENLVEEQGYFILPSELFANVRKSAPTNENLNETLEGVELDMNKVLSITMIVASMLIFVPKCDATDVWVEHWNNENIDVFIMDDTIVSYRGARSIGFTVSTKLVKNGTLQRVTNWTFDSLKGWKYSTNDGQHFNSPALFKNNIFEFCMNQLGWIYSIRDDGSYY